MSPGYRLGDAEAGWATFVGGVVHEPAFPLDQRVDQGVHIHYIIHVVLLRVAECNQMGDV